MDLGEGSMGSLGYPTRYAINGRQMVAVRKGFGDLEKTAHRPCSAPPSLPPSVLLASGTLRRLGSAPALAREEQERRAQPLP